MTTPLDPVESPCVRNCCLDDKDVCLGCFRNLSEIKAWQAADSATRQAILARAHARKTARAYKRFDGER